MARCKNTFQDMVTNGQTKYLGIVSEVPMGDWNSTTTYQKLNSVRHNGATYKAKTSSINVEPGVAENWQSVWMLCNYDGGVSSVVSDGTYPDMTVGTAQSLNKLSIGITQEQWQNNSVTITPEEYPVLQQLLDTSLPLLLSDDNSAIAVITSDISLSIGVNKSLILTCSSAPTQTISGVIIFI